MECRISDTLQPKLGFWIYIQIIYIQGQIYKQEEEHMADVTAAMLFLGCGGMDEAHNIVLPYSWPSDTHFGGPAVKDSPAAKESEYCHALIHRYQSILFELESE